jgi:hypothetical protein
MKLDTVLLKNGLNINHHGHVVIVSPCDQNKEIWLVNFLINF